MSGAIQDCTVPTRRTFLANAVATGALGLAPAALKAGDLAMITIAEPGTADVEAQQSPSANLFLVEDLENADRTRRLAQSDVTALRAVADWTKSFVIRPHKDLGRPGPLCPFTPVSIEHKALWMAPERSAARSTSNAPSTLNPNV